MIKKLIIPLAFLMIGMVSFSTPLSASTTYIMTGRDGITHSERVRVCAVLHRQRILSANESQELLRNGGLSISKIEKGDFQG